MGMGMGIEWEDEDEGVERASVVDMEEALRLTSSTSASAGLESASASAFASAASGGGVSMSDYWVPQVASNGQIYYKNTITGEESRDLPIEVEDEIEDDEGEEEPLGQTHRTQPPNPGFGVTLGKRTLTPEPWIRRLTDDGLSYFYWNTLDGSVSWTRPEKEKDRRCLFLLIFFWRFRF
ncbi:hypothetical protein F5880DRAFT_1603137 [Lentinula raphanica]|nr:hypothetical protein F5880DRAFT_1603137 [Lentinula raphanica]